MMRSCICIFLLLMATMTACTDETGNGQQTDKAVQEIRPGNTLSNADIIRNPVTASGVEDTVNVAKLTFDEHVYDFGKVTQGDVIEHTYTFTNTGNIPLIITNARSTCGCTVPAWPKEAIPPNGKGEINVRFNSAGKSKQQSKPITITANTNPKHTIIHIKGEVVTGKGNTANN